MPRPTPLAPRDSLLGSRYRRPVRRRSNRSARRTPPAARSSTRSTRRSTCRRRALCRSRSLGSTAPPRRTRESAIFTPFFCANAVIQSRSIVVPLCAINNKELTVPIYLGLLRRSLDISLTSAPQNPRPHALSKRRQPLLRYVRRRCPSCARKRPAAAGNGRR
jgi:hypothetical protein